MLQQAARRPDAGSAMHKCEQGRKDTQTHHTNTHTQTQGRCCSKQLVVLALQCNAQVLSKNREETHTHTNTHTHINN
jgi:hypothetical protein